MKNLVRGIRSYLEDLWTCNRNRTWPYVIRDRYGVVGAPRATAAVRALARRVDGPLWAMRLAVQRAGAWARTG